MNFFEHQDRARSVTKKLILLFVIAVIVLILVTSFFVSFLVSVSEQAPPPEFGLGLLQSDVFLTVAACVIGVVLLGALYRIAQLRHGGRVIAESMGGRLLERNQANPDELKILNVVEEMALASGVPVPPVYLIEDDAINAFAAGYRLHDAVIGITRGAVRLLKREELQGVVAHEFSHIFNGDMRLNLRLVGWLHGLLLIGIIGRSLLRTPRRRRSKEGGSAVVLGILLMLLGYAGILFGNLIKSAVSRQREFLADASAVQFTRNPDGIGNALKKIGGYPLGSRMLTRDVTEVNHMLFGEAIYGRLLPSWFATHPPLEQRIKRIDPRWDGTLINPDQKPQRSWSTLPEESQAPQFAPATPHHNAAQLADHVVASVGTPTDAALQLAQAQLAALPAAIRQQLDSPLGAGLLMCALLISESDQPIVAAQLDLLKTRYREAELKLLVSQWESLRQTSRALRFVLVELAQPLLLTFSRSQRDNFLRTVSALTASDGELSVYEWGFSRLLQYNLHEGSRDGNVEDLSSCLPQCMVLLAVLARAGHEDPEKAEAALRGSYAALDSREPSMPTATDSSLDFAALDAAVHKLQKLKPLQKPRLLKAMVLCMQHDGHLTDDETTLLRVVAILLDCPIPPLATAAPPTHKVP